VPACLILDVRMPGLSGLDLQRDLSEAHIHIPIIFITGHGDIPMSVRAMKAGAVEFLTKPFRDQDLLDGIQQALERDRRARSQQADSADLRNRYQSLTPRETEVFGLVVKGCSTNRSRYATWHKRNHSQTPSPPGHGENARRLPRRPGSNGGKTFLGQ
jgi:FixJ family two-component response regulator